jgi:hypothetical protein
MTTHSCSICGLPIVGYGHNAEPINKSRCCDRCNAEHVIPARLRRQRQDKADGEPSRDD